MALPYGPSEGAVHSSGFPGVSALDVLGEQGHAAVSELANLSARLGDAQERVKFAQQLDEVDL